MEKVTIYHNPRCSKSRQALLLLGEHRIQPYIIEYLKTPLKEKEIKQLLQLLQLSPRELMRKNETVYKELDLDNPKLSEHELIKAIVEHPILLERPIVVHNHKAVIARPPEKLLEII